MEQDTKFSRFMFHLKFSQTEDYLHEHELYEVMRSRNLYQTQFGVRSNFKKIMRNLSKDERQTRYGFENTRKLFVQKMKERREQIDKLRDSTSNKLNSLSTTQEKCKKIERQYVPLPQSTIVYTAFPPIESREPETIYVQPLSQENKDKPDDATLLPPAPSPSMVATVFTDDRNVKKEKSLLTDDQRPREQFYTTNVLVAGKTGPQTVTTKLVRSKKATSNEDSEPVAEMIEHEDLKDHLKRLKLEGNGENEDKFNDDFEQKTKLGEGEAQVSTVYLINKIPKRFTLRKSSMIPTESKVKFWAEKHGIIESKANLRKEADFQRMLIDRPSKWTMNNCYDDMVQSKILDMRLKYSRRMVTDSFRRKSRQLDHLSEKLMLKQRISLPELNTAPRPMVSLDPGGTTPDGRLILTKADYEEYLSDYKKARNVRLERSKKRNRLLEKRIENFILEPKLCLRDDTSLRASMHTI
ncbi:uncharacterized protein LOC123523552 [Mercenaria mercenaria]|uniref:uncharacterized protein LOC123523552 n=1 Tax=Mercenaria mercenaria TaxID=6596 RepID=UPI00234F774A|nr:uncharacterized protein LOC123523552 [Mercenaria mercenaria]